MASRILVVSPAWLGDIIMCQSLLKTLKHQDPSCVITMYAPSYAHCIIDRMSEVDEILENPFAHGQFDLSGRIQEGKKLKALNFDKAYVLPNSFKSALIPWFANIKERIGLKGESRYLLLNKMRKDKNSFARMVNRYVALAYVDDPSVKDDSTLPSFDYPSLITHKPSDELLARLKISLDRPLLVLGCGANYGPAKLWPPEYFAQLSLHFIKQNWSILALGSAKDKETVNAIKEHIKAQSADALEYFYDIAGQTSLTEALDLVGACSAGVCNDSGLMHTLAAANVPQACIFGSTSTKYTPPLSDKAVCVESTQPCHPCFKRTCQYNTYACLKELTVEKVINALNSVL